jgi:hypothetical protein
MILTLFGDPMRRRPRRAATAGAIVAVSIGPLATATGLPLPLPSVDYVATAKLAGNSQGTFRHSDGRLRMEFTVPGLPVSVTGFLDLAGKKAVVLSPMPGLRGAFEVDIGAELGYGAAFGTGERTGTDIVAGEACNVWRVEAPKADGPVTACITADGITLRTQATIRGKVETVLEVTSLKREAQDADTLKPPADLKVIRVPGGLKGLTPGALPLMPRP